MVQMNSQYKDYCRGKATNSGNEVTLPIRNALLLTTPELNDVHMGMEKGAFVPGKTTLYVVEKVPTSARQIGRAARSLGFRTVVLAKPLEKVTPADLPDEGLDLTFFDLCGNLMPGVLDMLLRCRDCFNLGCRVAFTYFGHWRSSDSNKWADRAAEAYDNQIPAEYLRELHECSADWLYKATLKSNTSNPFRRYALPYAMTRDVLPTGFSLETCTAYPTVACSSSQTMLFFCGNLVGPRKSVDELYTTPVARAIGYEDGPPASELAASELEPETVPSENGTENSSELVLESVA